ncbi:MAG: OmpA family protein [Myxococcaceae bacterium]|jgi:OOP family OmpA-OmpF porin|nr:OmpA family protein [Myxococcaceae bacterium]MCA3011679.1 OmpA family protein [Myxococcaceae bacterium]
MVRPLLVAVLLLPLVAFADPDDQEGCKDHPTVSRFPGFFLNECTANDFSSFEFPVGEDKTVAKEGRYWKVGYWLKEGARQPSPLEIARNYENAARKLGGRKVFQNVDQGGGDVTYAMPMGASERWFTVHVANGGGAMTFHVIEVAAMEQKVEMSASEMLSALEKDGFLSLYGVLFDTGKDTLKPESEALLGEILSLLTTNAALKLSVEGHTDNVGHPKANQALSQKRADRVRAWLVGKGVDGKRLATKGWGDARPVADNRTDEGKAKNRRVELVKR